MVRKLKILLSAYACEPNKGSEPEVGWKWATTLSKLGHEVYVITRQNNKENIENYLTNKKIPNLYFYYFDYSPWFIKIIKGKTNPRSYLYFFLWQIGIFFLARQMVKKIKFDFIHHVTFVSLRFPSFLCFLKVPFIFGPVAGGETSPYHLRKNWLFFNKITELFRDLSNYYIKVSLFMNITFSRSYKIFVTSEETKKVIPSRYHFKTEKLLAIGFDETSKPNSKSRSNAGLFNICYVGRLIYWKGLLIVLKTFSEIKKKNKNAILSIVGSGPMDTELKLQAKKLNIDQSIQWLGQIDRKELINFFNNKCDLLLMPSLRDSGGLVILEAMSCGVPVAALNLGGPGQLVDNECGIKIEVDNKSEDQIAFELSTLINDSIKNADELKNKKTKSLERVKKFTWDKKISRIYK